MGPCRSRLGLQRRHGHPRNLNLPPRTRPPKNLIPPGPVADLKRWRDALLTACGLIEPVIDLAPDVQTVLRTRRLHRELARVVRDGLDAPLYHKEP